MDRINALEVDDKSIVLKSDYEIERMYSLIMKEENFILISGKKSQLIIGSNISSKIRNGEIQVVAIDEGESKNDN